MPGQAASGGSHHIVKHIISRIQRRVTVGPVRLSPNTDVKIGGRTDQIKAVSPTPVVGLVRAHLRVQPCVKRRGRAQLMAGQLATAALRTAVVLALLT